MSDKLIDDPSNNPDPTSADATSVDSTAADASPEAEGNPTLLEQMGGLSGLVSSTVPVLVFIPVNNKWGLNSALIAALGVAVTIFIWRLLRKENLQPAISGFMGVGIGAAIAWYTGSAKGYFAYSIWMSLLFAVVFFISILVRWPMVGVIWKGINGDNMVWRKVPAARRAYTWATLGWAIVFISRFVVKRFFYQQDDVTGLGIVTLAMGWPLTLLVTMLTVWMVRKARAAMVAAGYEHDDDDDAPESPQPSATNAESPKQ